MRMVMVILLLWLGGCGGGDGGMHPPAGSQSSWQLQLEPSTRLNEAQPVLSISLRGDPGLPLPPDPILVEGEPSKLSISKYEVGETTETLAERIVPTLDWDAPGIVTLRPHYALAIGQRYTLLSRSGVHGVLQIRPAFEPNYLVRVWPPSDSQQPSLLAIYCATQVPRESVAIPLYPGETFGQIEPGLDETMIGSEHCVRLLVDSSRDGLVQPPTQWGEFSFEPTPIRGGALGPELARRACSSPLIPLGPGCLRTDSNYGTVQNASGTALWVLRSAFGWHSVVLEGGGQFGFPLGIDRPAMSVDAWVFDLAGRCTKGRADILLPPPAPHVVINEVMADPRGAEPGEEWIELLNAGRADAAMTGWRLRDQGGEVELPPVLLGPGAIALLVRNDFQGGQAGDVAPRVGATLVRLPTLGKNGLANGGEVLSLLDGQGLVVSTFPARPSDIEGTSVARRFPESPDDMASSFGPHASPDASPGAANHVE